MISARYCCITQHSALCTLPKGALLAGGKRLAPTGADSGDKSAQADRGGYNSALCIQHSAFFYNCLYINIKRRGGSLDLLNNTCGIDSIDVKLYYVKRQKFIK